ncbi:hypothetical protein FACS189472_09850 [Alphaproteobacteria bacterium]|nr:hypothetical protein FACS189472_09850 [Alphaproteobacteria bacterium]
MGHGVHSDPRLSQLAVTMVSVLTEPVSMAFLDLEISRSTVKGAQLSFTLSTLILVIEILYAIVSV